MLTKAWIFPLDKILILKSLRSLVACAMLAGLAGLIPVSKVWADKASTPRLTLAASDQAWLAGHPVIRLGIDTGYGPYSFLDDQGRPQGVVIEFLNHLGPALGVRFEIVSNLDWPQLMAAVKARQIDAVATVTYLPEREAFLAFTGIYLPTPLVIMTRTETPQLHSLQDLAGLSLVLVEGYSSSKEVMSSYPDLRPHYVATPLDGLRAVASGATDAYVGALGVNSYLAAQNGITNLKVNADFDMSVNGQRFGVRKDWPELARLLDQALASMPSQQKNKAFQEWLPLHANEIQRFSQPTLVTRLFPWLLGLATLTLLGYLATLLWNRQLKHELARRQGELLESTRRLSAAETIAHVGNWQYTVADGSVLFSDEAYRIFDLEPQLHPVNYDWVRAQLHSDDRVGLDAYLAHLLDSPPGDAPPNFVFGLYAPMARSAQSMFGHASSTLPWANPSFCSALFRTLAPTFKRTKGLRRSTGFIVC